MPEPSGWSRVARDEGGLRRSRRHGQDGAQSDVQLVGDERPHRSPGQGHEVERTSGGLLGHQRGGGSVHRSDQLQVARVLQVGHQHRPADGPGEAHHRADHAPLPAPHLTLHVGPGDAVIGLPTPGHEPTRRGDGGRHEHLRQFGGHPPGVEAAGLAQEPEGRLPVGPHRTGDGRRRDRSGIARPAADLHGAERAVHPSDHQQVLPGSDEHPSRELVPVEEGRGHRGESLQAAGAVHERHVPALEGHRQPATRGGRDRHRRGDRLGRQRHRGDEGRGGARTQEVERRRRRDTEARVGTGAETGPEHGRGVSGGSQDRGGGPHPESARDGRYHDPLEAGLERTGPDGPLAGGDGCRCEEGRERDG